MIKKWSAPAGLNEGDFAAKWRREWGDAIITRIEVNQGRRGGFRQTRTASRARTEVRRGTPTMFVGTQSCSRSSTLSG